MKKLKKLKLNQLVNSSLNELEMRELVGGAGNCCCSCWAYGNGGSSSADNSMANNKDDKKSYYDCNGGTPGNSYEEERLRLMTTGWCPAR